MTTAELFEELGAAAAVMYNDEPCFAVVDQAGGELVATFALEETICIMQARVTRIVVTGQIIQVTVDGTVAMIEILSAKRFS